MARSFDQNIWHAALGACRRLWFVVLLVLAMNTVLIVVKEWRDASSLGGGIPDAVVWGFLALAVMSDAIREPSQARTLFDAKVFAGFFTRAWLLSFISTIPALLLGAYLGANSPQHMMFWILIAGVPLGIVGQTIVYSLVGTMLPALAAAGDTGIASALRRGRATLKYVAARLLVGPGLMTVVFYSYLTWITIALPDGGSILSGEHPWNAQAIGASLIASLLGVVIIALGSVVLARAYLIAEEVVAPNVGEAGLAS